MTIVLRFAVVTTCLAAFASCERQKNDVIDPNYSSPFLLSLELSPDSLNLDFDTTVTRLGNNSYRISISAHGEAVRQSADEPLLLNVDAFTPNSSSSFQDWTVDLGSPSADTIPFTAAFTFKMRRSDAGACRFEFSLASSSNRVGNTLSRTLVVARRDSRPQIDSIMMPDTVTIGAIPSPDSSFLVAAAASDSDGISDIPYIGGVKFISVKPDGSLGNCGQPIDLFDDGSTLSLFGSTSGDLVAGDGIFSFRIRLFTRSKNGCPPPDSVDTERGIYTFKFFAIDNSGAVSDTVPHTLFVK